MAVDFNGSNNLAEGSDQPDILLRLRQLVEDKTRFEAKDIGLEKFNAIDQDFTVDVAIKLHEALQEREINGHWRAGSNDVKHSNSVEVTMGAQADAKIQLERAGQRLLTQLVDPQTTYDSLAEGAYLGAVSRHWQLSRCMPCHGKGRVNCYTCHGTRRETCYACSGSLQITCTGMGCRYGKTTCYSCHGTGSSTEQKTEYYSVNVPVNDANGHFSYYRTENHTRLVTVRVPCHNYACVGGQVTCTVCSGRGNISCPTCSATGSVTCRTCSGVGDLQCTPCVGSGEVGTAAQMDIHLSKETLLRWPENASPHAEKVEAREGLAGVVTQASEFGFARHALQLPGCLAQYQGKLAIEQLQASCNSKSYTIVAYGADAHWLSLDSMVQDLLHSDLEKLRAALAKMADGGPFDTEVTQLLTPLHDVVASEINADVVEAVLSQQNTRSHDAIVDAGYVERVKDSILGSLRHIYFRQAKAFAWRSALVALATAIVLHFLMGSGLATMTALLTLPMAYWWFNRRVRKLLEATLGGANKAQRAMRLAVSGGRHIQSLVLVLVPMGVLIVAAGYLLPAQQGPAHPGASPTTTPAAAQGADTVQSAIALYAQGHRQQAREILKKRAELGDEGAFGLYGYMVLCGQGLATEAVATCAQAATNYPPAKSWIDRGVARNDSSALAAKGLVLSQGWGEPINPSQGRDLLQRAARAGHVHAMHVLGLIFVNGDHVAVDYQQARLWFTMAAEKNSPADMFNVGLMDWNGDGASQPDRASAMRRWRAAAALGEPRAIKAVAQGAP